MRTFTYPFIAKVIYRYANIPLSLLLIFYLLVSISAVTIHYLNIIAVIINLALIIVLNRFYFNSYRIFPYRIDIEDDQMICSDFPFSDKIITIRFEDIDDISGGIFSGVQTKPIRIYDGNQNLTVAFSAHLKRFNELLTIILSKIKKEKYEEILARITEMANEQKEKRKSKKRWF